MYPVSPSAVSLWEPPPSQAHDRHPLAQSSLPLHAKAPVLPHSVIASPLCHYRLSTGVEPKWMPPALCILGTTAAAGTSIYLCVWWGMQGDAFSRAEASLTIPEPEYVRGALKSEVCLQEARGSRQDRAEVGGCWAVSQGLERSSRSGCLTARLFSLTSGTMQVLLLRPQ